MNFRGLISEYGYTHFVGLTYSFDPYFFESVILKDLIRYGTTNVIVFCDPNPLQNSLSFHKSDIRSLGADYILNPVHNYNGAFHPKFYLLLGHKSSKIILSSGNLTFGGTGGNQEIFTNWKIVDVDENLLAYTINYLQNFVNNELSNDFIDEMKDEYSVSDVFDYDISKRSIVFTPGDNNLASVLLKRWKGRTFNRLTIFTGSTDEKGAFIEWCREQFGIKSCTVVANTNSISFDKKYLEKIPVNIKLGLIDSGRLSHAKVYVFENKDDISLIIGSANCSAAAWLSPLNISGNMECIAIYENLKKKDIEHIHEKIPEETLDKSKWVRKIKKESDTQISQSFPIIENIKFDFVSNGLSLKFKDSNLSISKVTGSIDNYEIQFKKTEKDGLWYSQLIENLSKTNVIKIRVELDGKFRENYHWIDFPEKIRNFSLHQKIRTAIDAIGKAGTYRETSNLINELISIQQMLFDTASYQKSSGRHSLKTRIIEDSANELNKEYEKVTPDQIITSIHSSLNRKPLGLPGFVNSASFSMSGIIKFLFEDFQNEEEQEYDDTIIDEDSGEISGELKTRSKLGKNHLIDKNEQIKLYNKLNKFIDNYIDNLKSEEFCNKCTARQLSDITAFGLLIVIRILSINNYLKSLASKLLYGIVQVLFFNKLKDVNGLYKSVQKRYTENQLESLFINEISGGLLWSSLVYALLLQDVNKKISVLINSMALKYIYRDSDILNHIDIGSMNYFISNLKTKKIFEKLLSHTPEIVKQYEGIEIQLQVRYDELLLRRTANEYNVDQLIYNKKLGWGKVLDVDYAEERMDVLVLLTGEKKVIKTQGFWLIPFSDEKIFNNVKNEFNLLKKLYLKINDE